MLTEAQYCQLQVAHLTAAADTEGYGEAAGQHPLCGILESGDVVLLRWSFRTVAKSFHPHRRPCKCCRNISGI